MYDSVNLPLSLWKPFKRTIKSFLSLLPLLTSSLLITFFIVLLIIKDGRLTLIFISLVVIAIVLLDALYQYFYYKSYYYKFDDDRGQIKKGVVGRTTGFVRYEKLQSIYVDQDILDRLFNLYDVHYETAGQISDFYSHIDGLNKDNADKLTAFLTSKVGLKTSETDIPAKNVSSLQIEKKEKEESLISSKEIPLSRGIIKARTMALSIGFFPVVLMVVWFSAVLMPPSLRGLLFWSLPIILMLLILLSYIHSRVWYRNFYFDFGINKGEIRTKVIGQSISYIYYDRIQDIAMSQVWIERLFGVFTISIETAGGMSSQVLVLSGYKVEDAEKIRDFLIEKAKYYKAHL